jgi:recombination protein RecT
MEDFKQKFLDQVQEMGGCKNSSLVLNYYTKLNAELLKQKPVKNWSQVKLADYVSKAIAYSNIEIDPLSKNMLSFIFFGSDIVFVQDVRCVEMLARKYGVNCPENITIELIYSNDKFSLIKKDLSNSKDGYLFQITSPLDRGEICGGIALSEYKNPIYNKVRFLGMKDIAKRTSTTTSFWRDWKENMCEKTIGKYAWSFVALDTTKLAEFYSATIQENIPEEYIPESTEDLPFDPDNEL